MAVTCARCGTQNPDGNQFCQACGTPLAVAAMQPVAPPSQLPGPPAAPPPPPPGYQSPYYAPSAVGPQPPVHRTPWTLIIAGIVVLVLLMAGCGTAIAVFGGRTSGSNQGAGLLPSPSPAGTPSPVGNPTPTPGTTASGTASNPGVSFNLPAGWTVVNKDDQSITITNPDSTGSITIGSGASNPAQNAQQNKDTVDKFFQSKYPDAKDCPGSKTSTGSLNGAQGIVWELCFTLTSGSQSVPAAAPLFAGANADGSVYYVILILATQADVKTFVTAAAPILNSIQWKLK
jgi:zinc-ribbon domain